MAEVQLKKPETAPEQKEEPPPCIDDFVEPNKMIQPWMLPYLPKGAYYREGVFDLVGLGSCGIVGFLIGQIKSLEFLDFVISFGGGGLFLYNGWWRILAAGVLYGRAKKKYREAQKNRLNSSVPNLQN